MAMRLQDLPSEVLLSIFAHVPVLELLSRVCRVCRQFRELLASDWFWSTRYQAMLGAAPVHGLAGVAHDWQRGCVQAHFLRGCGRRGRGENFESTLLSTALGGLDCVHLMYPEVHGASMLIAAGSRDSTVYVWRRRAGRGAEEEEVEGGRQMRSFTNAALRGHRGWVWSLASEPSRPSLLCSGGWDHSVRMWDVAIGSQVASIPDKHKAAVLCLALPSPNHLVSACFDKHVRTFDLRLPISLASEHKEHRKPVLALAATEHYIYSGSEDRCLVVWDCRANRLLQRVKLDALVTSLHCGADVLSCAGGRRVRLYNCSTGDLKEAAWFDTEHSQNLTAVLHTRAMVATASKDGTARLHSIGVGHRCLATLDLHTSAITAIDFSRNTLALASGDRRVSLWKTN